MSIDREDFGQNGQGQKADIYTLKNGRGMTAKITNYGAILVSLSVPDARGNAEDVTLGFEELAGYLGDHPYFGSTIGRYGNRIEKGSFTLQGETYELAQNNMGNHLHGGIKGFNRVMWDAQPVESDQGVGLRLNYLSPDGQEGYPGNLKTQVTYLLTEENELQIHYQAQTDKPTVVNLTNHTYWNLDGQGEGTILDHRLMLDADHYTPVNETLIPTGEIESVKDTPMDFTQPKRIGAEIGEVKGGYDHNFVLNGEIGRLKLAAKLSGPDSGRVMEVSTTEPGIQFYTGNFLDGTLTGKDGKVYEKNYGLCLETQHFPNSPNQSNFPSTVLAPGDKYQSTTIYKFSNE